MLSFFLLVMSRFSLRLRFCYFRFFDKRIRDSPRSPLVPLNYRTLQNHYSNPSMTDCPKSLTCPGSIYFLSFETGWVLNQSLEPSCRKFRRAVLTIYILYSRKGDMEYSLSKAKADLYKLLRGCYCIVNLVHACLLGLSRMSLA